jgi:hypothetical protein
MIYTNSLSPLCLTQKACCTDNDFTGIVSTVPASTTPFFVLSPLLAVLDLIVILRLMLGATTSHSRLTSPGPLTRRGVGRGRVGQRMGNNRWFLFFCSGTRTTQLSSFPSSSLRSRAHVAHLAMKYTL